MLLPGKWHYLSLLFVSVFVFVTYTGFFFWEASTAWGAERNREKPENIILFIGDGMGVTHVTAGKVVAGSLNLERFPVGGLMTTFADPEFVTDSAASGTALATGHKTYNGGISVSPHGQPFKTVAEYAEEIGMATGLVVTCSVTHATPAVFVSHVRSRNDNNEIARQITDSGVDILFGGGLSYFIPRSLEGSNRDDNENLLDELKGKMIVVTERSELEAIAGCRNIAYLFTLRHPPRVKFREMTLAELTSQALKHLSCRKKGFFLMVEGSQIDWGGHQNDEDYILSELIDFDRAVGVGLDFAEKNGRTLVIATSDHETGGYALHDGSVEGKKITARGFTCDQHTAAMVPIFSFGPGSYQLGGIHDNTFVGGKMIEYIKAKSDQKH
jgi:alkaline phosphatase